ncbi:MAG: nuclear transport factor 2 family protein [Flavobacterium sp.]
MDAKELIQEYYKLEGFRDVAESQKFIHDEMELKWHSSKGYLELDKNDFLALVAEMGKSYCASRLDISHIIAEGNNVTVRYTHYVCAIENPTEEMTLAHFVVIWEVKHGKLYRGYLMSQLG